MEPAQAQVTVTYTIHTSVEEAHLEYFTLADLDSCFHCPNNFLAGDRVKVTIQKVPTHVQQSVPAYANPARNPVPEDR